MDTTSFAAWQQWSAAGYRNLPYIARRAGSGRLPAVWLESLREAKDAAFILESGKAGRYTYVGFEPTRLIVGKNDAARILERVPDGGWREVRRVTGKPLEAVKAWLAPHRTPRVPDAPKFIGGCVGFWSYDVARTIERLPELAADDLGLPDYIWMRADRMWIVDHAEAALYAAVHTDVPPEAANDPDALFRLYQRAAADGEAMLERWEVMRRAAAVSAWPERLERVMGRFRTEELHFDVERLPGLETAFPRPAFINAVRRIQDYIRSGDVFQVNLSVRQSRPLAADAALVYEVLRRLNPSPYMGYVRLPGFELVCGSPELLVRLVDGLTEARPIAGTRRRGRTEEEDRAFERELRTTVKEIAEHIMLVDLLRNDLGRVAAFGSVRVPELMTVERYSHVMHLVSHVTGRLAPGRDAFDLVAATFPGGTITGAPKVRTMEIIEELEPVRRGPYTGSIGWIDYNGDMELNITIRTMVAKDGMAYVQAGAGVVIDSQPEREYKECLNKARALWKAQEYGEQLTKERES